ncbi:MAG: hypothetical protein M1823_002655 [Watsoniomyces obsoletus]|nr:MAG: hypothetical protein M1823_002655 [Watsoniomyces obsoletus]
MAPGRSFNIKRIAIIGGGPSGIATAKYLLAEKTFDVIDIYEQRATFGGVWNYSPTTVKELKSLPRETIRKFGVTDGDVSAASSLATKPEEATYEQHGVFLSPMYDKLETNIPISMMRFSDFSFPEGSSLFPGRDSVRQYLDDYAKDIERLVHFRSQVLQVSSAHTANEPGWLVKVKDLVSSDTREVQYDAVVVASGHYDVPYIPDIKGLANWNKRYPGAISHSKYYRSAEAFKNKKVIVVGNSASGSDIAAQICRSCRGPLLISRRRAIPLPLIPPELKEEVPEIEEFLPDRPALKFRDGTVQEDVDFVLFCTGYLFSYPFLASLQPPVVSDGSRVEHVYQHIFYTHRPTLAFVALPMKVIPFPLSESQAAIIARVWAKRLPLPSVEMMQDWENRILCERGGNKAFHTLSFPLDADYIRELYLWCLQARPGPNGAGKIPPVWGADKRWIRSKIPSIKEAFVNLGEERHRVERMEELGFHVDPKELSAPEESPLAIP